LKFKMIALCAASAPCLQASFHNDNHGPPVKCNPSPSAPLPSKNCEYCCNFTAGASTGVYNKPLGGPWRGKGPYNVARFGTNPWGDGQLFGDCRNVDAQDFWAKHVALKAPQNAYVDGIFTDDPAGYGQEHPVIQYMVQLSPAEIAALQSGTQRAWQ